MKICFNHDDIEGIVLAHLAGLFPGKRFDHIYGLGYTEVTAEVADPPLAAPAPTPPMRPPFPPEPIERDPPEDEIQF